MSERFSRSVAKGISWRIVGSIDTFLIAFLITGHFKAAGGIAAVEVFTKVLLYALHERIWLRVPWGRQDVPVAQPTVQGTE